ncbi:MAG: patatin-like phospholipase family protein [Gammaproteobacteria bacterium]|nr:patatin-like phospholipase family protein [Gammaproteobacteria bacterium]
MNHKNNNSNYIKGSIELPDDIQRQEHEHISNRRKQCNQRFYKNSEENILNTNKETIKKSLTGLAISGGGIRSASFALGVMQALESKGLMKRFDYLSTVSGGGYIGGSLSWFLNRNSKSCPSFKFSESQYPWPWGSNNPDIGKKETTNKDDIKKDDTEKQKKYLDYFRQHGEYLKPGGGISIWSLISVVIRAVFLNLVIYIPLLTSLIVVFLIATTDKELFFPGNPPEVVQNFMYPIYAVQQNIMSAWLLVAAVTVALISAIFALTYSLSTRLVQLVKIPISKYGARRRIEEYSGYILLIFILCAIGGLLPALNQILYNLTDELHLGWSNGVIMPFVGLLSALVPMYQIFKDHLNSSMDKFVIIAVNLLLLGLLMSSYNLALFSISLSGETTGFSLACSENKCYEAYEVIGAFFSVAIFSIPNFWLYFLAIAILSGAFVNLNYISIHRYYRDRLMEAYMQEIPTVLSGKTKKANNADRLSISDLYGKTHKERENTIAPYHLINTNIILVGDDNKKYKNRGGDSFIISPVYCGSTATGWSLSKKFMKNGMTLPTAVSISGAAANPNTAPGGKGLTRSKGVSMLMSLFNVRLGYWAPNPNPSPGKYILNKNRRTPNHFQAAIYELFMDSKKDSAYVQLSDGGHFENLAVYELIRRRCKLIVLSDAAADPSFGFSDLQILLRRIEQDFNTTIEFKGQNSIDNMIPNIEKLYPSRLKVAKQGFVVGKIKYPDMQADEAAYLIYIKSTLIEELNIKLLGYKSLNPAYPDESTADQFFDPEQFDAYRELGYELCQKMLESGGEAYLMGDFSQAMG